MNKFFLSLLTIIMLIESKQMLTQCDSSMVEVQMNVTTDSWGYETYWEMVYADSSCGQGTLYWGGNEGVGCDGNASNGGYPSNTILLEDSLCIHPDSVYHLIFVDSYGDGGLTFELFVDGGYYGTYTGTGSGNVWTIEPGNSPFPPNDSPCNAAALTVNGPEVELITAGAGIQNNEPSPDGGACGTPGLWCEGDISNTAWAKFTAQANVSYQITTCNTGPGFDTQLAIYKVGNCLDFSTYELVAANDDTPVGCSSANIYSSLVTVSCLEEGQTYYVQLDGYYGENGTAYLTLTEVAVDNLLQFVPSSIACPLNKGEIPNGSIYPYFTGGSIEFTCVWTGPNGYSSDQNTITNLEPGLYECTALDACGNSYSGSAEITQPQAWNISISSLSPQCDSALNGEINITVSGATTPYTYAWSGPNNALYSAEDLTGLPPGSYEVIITDQNGCIRSQNINLPPSNSFTFSIGEDTTLCDNVALGIEGPVNCTYNWSTGDSIQDIVIAPNTFAPGNHIIILTATNQNHCIFSDAVNLEVLDCNVGVNETTNTRLYLYPNPSQGNFRIIMGTDMKLDNLDIFNMQGLLVFSSQLLTRDQTIETQLAAGVYQIRIFVDGKSTTMPLIVH